MMKNVLALLFLFTVSMAVNPYEFMPCSFQITTYTRILSGGSLLGTSDDTVYRDHDNLWRWDSDFTGVSGIFEAHVWSVIWRPDYNASYHQNMMSGACLKNNGGSTMYPYPYDWMLSKFDQLTWTKEECTYNDKPAYRYNAKGKSTRYQFNVELDTYSLLTGEFLHANGTVESNMIDVEFETDVNQFVSHKPVPAKLFMTPCEKLVYPSDPSKEFVDVCYNYKTHSSSLAGSAGFAITPSVFVLFVSLLAIFLICIAL